MTEEQFSDAAPIVAKLEELAALLPGLAGDTIVVMQLDPSYVQQSQLATEITTAFEAAKTQFIADLTTLQTSLQADLAAI